MAHRFLNSYVLINSLLLSLYFPLRILTPRHYLEGLVQRDAYFGRIPKEVEIYLMTVLFLVTKYRKSPTSDAFLQTFFLYTKTGLAALCYYISWQLFLWYALVVVLLFLMVTVPKYAGPECLTHFNATSFDRMLQSPRSDYLVYFHADWCQNSLDHDAMFSQLSLDFSDQLKFAKLDLSRYPEIAQQFNIDTSPNSWQLPTFILFQQGKELARLPKFDGKGEVIKTICDRKGLIAYFKLDKQATEEKKKK